MQERQLLIFFDQYASRVSEARRPSKKKNRTYKY